MPCRCALGGTAIASTQPVSGGETVGSFGNALARTKPTGCPLFIANRPACTLPVAGRVLNSIKRDVIAKSGPHAAFHIVTSAEM